MNSTAVAALAAFEEWMTEDEHFEVPHGFEIARVIGADRFVRRGREDVPLSWRVHLHYAERKAVIHGVSMSDALANAAQVIIADPRLEEV